MFRRGKAALLGTKDDPIKMVNDRSSLTEKHFVEIRYHFLESTRRLAKKRNAYDELAKVIRAYVDDEAINVTLSDGLLGLSNCITSLSDVMDLKVRRMESKIITPLAQLETASKTSRERLRIAVIARDKEVQKQQQMMELKTKFAANNSAADSELAKTKHEVNRANKEIDNLITESEKQKLSDLKTLFIDYILISLQHHTKSLEVLTHSYVNIANMDENADLKALLKILKTKKKLDKLTKSITEEDKDAIIKARKRKSDLRSHSMDNLDRDEDMEPIKRLSHRTMSTKNLAELESEQDDDSDDSNDDYDNDDDLDHNNNDDDDVESDAEEDDNYDDDVDDADKDNRGAAGDGITRKLRGRAALSELDEDEETADSPPDDDDSGTISEDESDFVQKGAKPKTKMQAKDPFRASGGLTHVKAAAQPKTRSQKSPFSAK